MSSSRIAIVVDSTAQIPEELIKHHNIHVIPQILIWGTEEFLDNIDIKPTEFYNRLKTSAEVPKTSQATIWQFQDLFTKLGKEADGILAVVISSELSGTLNSAIQAKAALPDLDIEIVDSRTTAMPLGYITLQAARAAEAGKTLAEVAQVARDCVNKVGVYFVVDTLEFLHRGGRIGGAQRFLGTALNIKPILAVENGKIEAIERVRTRRKAHQYLLDAVAERIAGKQKVHIATLHAAAPDEAAALLAEAKERFQPVEAYMAEVSPVIGVYAGPGTVGLTWFAE